MVHQDAKITVPDVRGMSEKEAIKLLQAKDLVPVIIDSNYKKEAKPGEILNQDPICSLLVKPGRKIYLTVNQYSPPVIQMPNLVDLSLRQAQVVARSYDLNITVQYRPAGCKGCVVEQLYKGKPIKAGTPVVRESNIVLVVGEGNAGLMVPVPYLIGMSMEQVMLKLSEVGLNAGAEVYDETIGTARDSLRARVYKQRPSASSSVHVPAGSSVDVWLTLDENKIFYNPSVSDSLTQQKP